MENIVAVELYRQKFYFNESLEIYYWKDHAGLEVDFVIKQGLKITQLIQVCYNLSDEQTKTREIRSLLKASEELKCYNLLIVTSDYEAEEKYKNKPIKYIPLWKWLLENNLKSKTNLKILNLES